MKRIALAGLLVALGAACTSGGGDDDDDSTSSPSPTPTPTSTPPPACASAGAELVYLLDDAYQLLSFDPALLGADPYDVIGTPACAAGAAIAPYTDPATPYAMTVDAEGLAWILYTSGELFRVSTADASCSAVPFAPQQSAGGTTWSLFGTAFSSDASGGGAERMWISGGATDGSLGSLGVVNPATLAVSRVGALGGAAPTRPELMGLSDATLWGFFPDTAAGFVQQIDKTNAMLLGSSMSIAVGGGDSLVAWGAAQHGGTFYLFVTTTDGITGNSTIRTITRSNGQYALVLQNQPHVVVAAASSTCAPIAP